MEDVEIVTLECKKNVVSTFFRNGTYLAAQRASCSIQTIDSIWDVNCIKWTTCAKKCYMKLFLLYITSGTTMFLTFFSNPQELTKVFLQNSTKF